MAPTSKSPTSRPQQRNHLRLKADEVQKLSDAGTYNPWDVYNKDPRVKNVMDSSIHGARGP
jgi:hypothetical protein